MSLPNLQSSNQTNALIRVRQQPKRERHEDFLAAGFKQDWIDKLTLARPWLYDDIRGKLDALKSLGFRDPVKLVAAHPNILSYARGTIIEKIAALKWRGFNEPIRLIEAQPKILGLCLNNIDRKIRLLQRTFGTRAQAICELEAMPALVSYKWRRILFVIRLSGPSGLKRLIATNPQRLAAARGATGARCPRKLLSATRLQNGADVTADIGAMLADGRLTPQIGRALLRL